MELKTIFVFISLVFAVLLDHTSANRYWRPRRNSFAAGIPPNAGVSEQPISDIGSDLAQIAQRRGSIQQSMTQPYHPPFLALPMPNPPQSRPFVPQHSLLAGRRAAPESEVGGPAGPPPITNPITENPDDAPYLYGVFNDVGFLQARRRRLRGRTAPMGLSLNGNGRRDILPWFRDSVGNQNFRGGVHNNPLLEQRSFVPGGGPSMPFAPPRTPARMLPLLGRNGGAGYGLGGAQGYPNLYSACFGGVGGCPAFYGAHSAAIFAPQLNYGYGGRNNYNNDHKQLQNINLADYGGPTTSLNPSGGGGGGGYGNGGGHSNNNRNKNNYSSRQLNSYLFQKPGSSKSHQTVSGRSNNITVHVQATAANKTTHEIINFPQPQPKKSDSSPEPSTAIQQRLNSHKQHRSKNHHLTSRRQHKPTDDQKETRSRFSTLIARLDRTVRRRSLTGGPKLAFDVARYNFRDVLCPAFNNDVIGSVRASLVDKGRRVKNGETYFLRYSLPNFAEGGLKIDPVSGDISVAAEHNKNGRFSLKFGDPPLVLSVLASLNKLSGEKFAQIFVPVAQATAKVVVECL